MVKKIAIIPAAGVGSRWGGYPKFILPCGEGAWMLDRTIRSFPEDAKKIVVYSPETLPEIMFHLERTGLRGEVELVENERMDLDFWGSMLAGLLSEADYYYFAMPDTYFDASVFGNMDTENGLSMGIHWTTKPERFGMLRAEFHGGNVHVENKSAGDSGWAWGTLGWDKVVRDKWLNADIKTYTEAINLAMAECGYHLIPMKYYKDFATFQDYAEFIKWLNSQ